MSSTRNQSFLSSVPVTRRTVVAGGLTAAAVLIAGQPAAAQDASPDSITVSTAFGEVTVPAVINSVVVTEGRRDLDIALSLDLPLIAYPVDASPDDVSGLVSPMADAIALAESNGAEALLTRNEIDIEVVVGLQPDLILGRDEDLEKTWDRLAAIAPVLPVGSTGTGVDWRDDLRFIADATGRGDLGEAVLATYAERVAATATLANTIVGLPILACTISDDGMEVIPTRLQTLVLQDVGVTLTQSLVDAFASGESRSFSREEVADLAGDAEGIILVIDTIDQIEILQTDPLWEAVPAVRAGRIVLSDKATNEGGPITATHCLGLIEELIALFPDPATPAA